MNNKFLPVRKIFISFILCIAFVVSGYAQSNNQSVQVRSNKNNDTLKNDPQKAQPDEEELNSVEYLARRFKLFPLKLSVEGKESRNEEIVKTLLISFFATLILIGFLVIRNWRLNKHLHKSKIALQNSNALLEKFKNDNRINSVEIMGLCSQMNLHFIFNCLNSINRFILINDTEAASSYLTKFSKLIRMVLENSQQSLISLEEDVKCLELYIQMEQFLFKNAFQYYIKYHDGVNKEETMVPPLLLQPFVENAIWHGITPKGGEGKIGIEFMQKEDALYCVIRDNGVGIKKALGLKSLESGNHKSVGLQITKDRLAILGNHHDDESLVEIKDLGDENSLEEGTQVTIKIYSLPTMEELKPSLY